MKRLNKILIISFILSCCFWSIAFAGNTDCENFAILSFSQTWSKDNGFEIINTVRETSSYRYSNFLTIDEQLAIIDKPSLNTAMLNLKKYCCENEIWWLTQKSETCKKDKAFFNPNVPDSPYLFDHLFDVIMRRLSWLTWDTDIYTYSNMTTDEKWTERRSRISEQAENISGAIPQTIIDKYQIFRTQSPSNLNYDLAKKFDATFWNLSDEWFLAYVSWQWSESEQSESKTVAKALKEYNKRTLYDRFNNAAALTEYFYSLLNLGNQWNGTTDRTRIINIIANGSYNKLIQNRINAENLYTQLVLQKSSNLFLENYTAWYVSYVAWRSENLSNTRTKISNLFLDVIRAVPKLVKRCVK